MDVARPGFRKFEGASIGAAAWVPLVVVVVVSSLIGIRRGWTNNVEGVEEAEEEEALFLPASPIMRPRQWSKGGVAWLGMWWWWGGGFSGGI
jgi:hypothetical protein